MARSALEFDKPLDQIAERLAGADLQALREREGADMRAKFALIALDRKKLPELYQEIYERYVKFRVTQRRANHAPNVSAQHQAPKYRLDASGSTPVVAAVLFLLHLPQIHATITDEPLM